MHFRKACRPRRAFAEPGPQKEIYREVEDGQGRARAKKQKKKGRKGKKAPCAIYLF
jgi:hypothetical protein